MSARSDVVVDWRPSPRVITVLAPSLSITVQDLLDTCREAEDDPPNMIYASLARAAGKDNLGGGVRVGITLTLLDAVLAFEARSGPSFVQCVVDGGNLVAVDVGGASVSPIEPTPFTQVVIAQSSSATLQDLTSLDYAAIASAVWARVVDGTLTAEQSIRVMNAVLSGKVSGAGSGVEIFRDVSDTKNRVVVTVDADGNRSSVVRDVT